MLSNLSAELAVLCTIKMTQANIMTSSLADNRRNVPRRRVPVLVTFLMKNSVDVGVSRYGLSSLAKHGSQFEM